MRNFNIQAILVSLISLILSQSIQCFIPNIHHHATVVPSQKIKLTSLQQNLITVSKTYLQNNSNEENEIKATAEEIATSKPSDIMLLSFDGAVADTSDWRSNLAINVAYKTWPRELQTKEFSNYNYYNDMPESSSTDRLWLVNKLNALMQYVLSDQTGCDAVLLTRLFLEEQLLDNGQSIGKSGKYASKYHPNPSSSSSDYKNENLRNDEKQRNGSRPLTVGEIAANWLDGACLKDTVRIKYNIERKDPIPIIEQNMFDEVERQNHNIGSLPVVNPIMKDILSQFKGRVYIMVGHKSHVPIAISSLANASIHVEVKQLDEIGDESTDDNCEGMVFIVSPGNGCRGHVGILQQVLMSAENGSSIHMIHSVLKILEDAKMLFGDNRPIMGGFGKSAIGNNVNLKLSVSAWAECTGPKQQDDALMMAPWLNVYDKSAFQVSLSENTTKS